MNRNDELKPVVPAHHSVQSENRETITLTGVRSVDSFNEKEVQALTELGEIVVFGSGLHITKLDLDAGHLSLSGTINGFEYLKQEKPGFWGRIFG